MTEITTRAAHLAWAKARALQYCDLGEPGHALASLGIDLERHPETANHAGIQLGMMQIMAGGLTTAGEMREFIEGFN